jgi:hypothetical protein
MLLTLFVKFCKEVRRLIYTNEKDVPIISEKIELSYLPPYCPEYCPEYNPDELLSNTPKIIRSFFHVETTK